MPKFPIDLGKKMSEPCCPKMMESDSKNEKYYPSVYLDWDDKYDLPPSGEMTVRFVRNSVTTTQDKKGDERQSVSLDIKAILSVKPDKEKDDDSEEDSGKALDKLKEESDYDEEKD